MVKKIKVTVRSHGYKELALIDDYTNYSVAMAMASYIMEHAEDFNDFKVEIFWESEGEPAPEEE